MSNKNIQDIVDALKNASSGRDIYEALLHVPTDNLLYMHNMIVNIINSREPDEVNLDARVSKQDKDEVNHVEAN